MSDPNIHVCSDWHLGHETIEEAGLRPSGSSRMILEHLKTCGIRAGDVLLNLGDLTFSPEGKLIAEEIMAWLSENRISSVLVLGNHDGSSFVKHRRRGWSWVCSRTSLRCFGKRILFTHEPEEAFSEDYNVHGHLHQLDGHRGGLIADGKHILVSMELMRYRPIPLARLVELGATPAYVLGRFVRAV